MTTDLSPAAPPAALGPTLAVVPDGEGFHAPTHVFGTPGVFGGQLLGQAVEAARVVAEGSVPGLVAVAVQARFVRAGTAGDPLRHDAVLHSAGRRSALVQVAVSQEGRGVLALVLVSFDLRSPGAEVVGESGARVRPPAGGGPSPFVDRWKFHALELDHLDERARSGAVRAGHPVWVRAAEVELGGVSAEAYLAFLSDLGVVLRAVDPGGLRRSFPVTVGQSLWLHRAPDPGEWLLLEVRRSSRVGDRATLAVRLGDVDGGLVADAIQEVVVRPLRPADGGV